MLEFLNNFFKRENSDELNHQSNIKNLKMDISERETEIQNLKNEIERLRSGEKSQINSMRKKDREDLLKLMAGPISQILLQEYLKKEGKMISAENVLSIAMNFYYNFKDWGLNTTGEMGEQVKYDPRFHTPLGDESFNEGENVVVKIVGITYQNKVLQQAMVAKN